MAESSSEALLQLELRLLRCSFSPPTTSTATTTTTTTTTTNSDNISPPSTISQKEKPILLLVESVINSIEKGNYLEALSSDAASRLLATEESFNIQDDTNGFYSEIEKRIDSFILQNGSKEEDEKSCRALLLMSVGVAALLAFTQSNLTGPCEAFPSLPLPYLLQKDDKTASKVGAAWDMWARNQLMSSTGSDLLGKFSIPQYILYAKMLLTKTKDMSCEGNGHALLGARSISWWLSRALLLQQRILNELSSSLFDSLQVLIAETLENFGKLEDVKRYWGSKLREGEASTIVSMAHLEAGIVDYTYSRVDSSRHHFNTAEEASGMQLSVTGILGFRTLHQVEATAQMVLVANTVTSQIGDVCLTGSPELQRNVSDSTENKLGSHSRETFEASDILMTPKLVENGKDGGVGANGTQNGLTATIALEAIQQAVILARCLIIEKNTPYGEMQRWDMAPFIEAVDAQVCSYFIIQCFCDILRVRWESTRSRTKERALLMMDKLVQNVYESSPGSAERIHFSYGVYLPTVPALRKEYGELLVSCGMIGEALKLFEDLELWDNLIRCYCLLEKKAAAVELIKARLCVTPNDPRLWCSLGDVTNTDSHYEKALEVSNNRSARAKRSLARSAYNKGEYGASKVLWESAMALNSLYPDGWFALGAAALKARDIDKALDGFTRAVQLDPDNGEAWNNIGCLHMIKKKNKESFIAFKEALKFRRNNWELWLNLSQVAVDIQNFGQALEATKMVLDLTNSRSINANVLESIMVEMANVLERIMAEIESRTSKNNLLPYAANGDLNCTIHTHPGDSNDERKHSEINLPSSRETDQLVEALGRVLQQIIRSGKGEKVWGLYARWHKIKGDLLMCSEAFLKQVRSYQGADLWSNRDRFKKYVSASLQLCEVYMAISLSTGSRRELNSAEMHLRSAVKQAVNFSEMDEFRSLQACLDEVRKRLQSMSIPSATIL